jgi:hypothetical protein
MDELIGLNRPCAGERFARGDEQSERPIAEMFHDSASGPSAHAGQSGEAVPHRRERQRVSEGDGRFRPAIDAQQRALRDLEQRFVEGHLFGAAAGSFVIKEIDYIEERHCKINSVLRSISQLWHLAAI